MSRAIFLCLLLLCLSGQAQESPVDRRIILQIGPYSVSAYRLEKHLRGFQESNSHESKTLSSFAEQFLIEQVLIQRALQEGYGTRAEVADVVMRMERHMISSLQGPFYTRLLDQQTSPAKRLERYRAAMHRQLDVVVGRVNTPQQRDDLVAALSSCPNAEARRTQLAAYAQARTTELFEKRIAWPFDEQPLFGDALDICNAGDVLTAEGEDGHYICVVAGVLQDSTQFSTTPTEVFQLIVGHTSRERLAATRRGEVLTRARLQIDHVTIGQLAERYRHHGTSDGSLAAAVVGGGARDVLATYDGPTGPTCIPVAGFAAYLNGLIVRRIPSSDQDWIVGLRDQVMAEFDVADARAVGILADAKFEEDRSNFRDYQALELYRREKLIPSITISPESVDSRYQRKKSELTAPTRLRGQLLFFSDPNAARKFALEAPARSVTELPGPSRIVEAEFGREECPATLAGMASSLFSPNAPSILGPFSDGNEWIIWRRDAVVETRTPGLDDVATSIREELIKEALVTRERDRAKELVRVLPVTDHIDYSRFGPLGSVIRPWDSRNSTPQ